MLQPDKTLPGLFAVHLILVKLRLLAIEKTDHEKLYDVLDWAELLPDLMGRSDDTTEEFREALAALGERHADFAGLVVNFDRNVSWAATGATQPEAAAN